MFSYLFAQFIFNCPGVKMCRYLLKISLNNLDFVKYSRLNCLNWLDLSQFILVCLNLSEFVLVDLNCYNLS